MPTRTPSRVISAPVATRRTARRTLSEQLDSLLALREDLSSRWPLALDAQRARERVALGQVAFDALEVIGGAGDLEVPFLRVTAAFERAGLLSSSEAATVRQRASTVDDLVVGWIGGERLPRGGTRRMALGVAAVLGNSILKRAAGEVRGTSAILSRWRRLECPCCGGAPDFAFTSGEARRLVCARCDTVWRTERAGCLGCGAASPPALARIAALDIGYDLAICNSCGRYVKERTGAGRLGEPLIERMLTAHLDAAAEQRGLRL